MKEAEQESQYKVRTRSRKPQLKVGRGSSRRWGGVASSDLQKTDRL